MNRLSVSLFSLFPLPSSPLDQRPIHRLVESGHPGLWKVFSFFKFFFLKGAGGEIFGTNTNTLSYITLRGRIQVFCLTCTGSTIQSPQSTESHGLFNFTVFEPIRDMQWSPK